MMAVSELLVNKQTYFIGKRTAFGFITYPRCQLGFAFVWDARIEGGTAGHFAHIWILYKNHI